MTKPLIGVLFRSYAKTKEQVPEVVERAIASVRKANVFFDQTIVAVPTGIDCGETVTRLMRAITTESLSAIVLPSFGSPNRDVLNHALAELQGAVAFVAIVSHKATEYMSIEVLDRAVALLQSGFKVVGVRINELDDVQEMPIVNTFAIWDVSALLDADGFDSEIGVEEVTALARLMKSSSKSAALISVPSVQSKLNIRQSAEGQSKHKEVRDTKRERQEQEAARAGVTLEWINQNIVII